VERPAVRGFISYLNPKVEDEMIPKKTCMAESVMTKVEKLDNLTIELIKVCISFHFNFSIHLLTSIIQTINSKISLVWDGWSTRNRRPYTSVSVVYIHSPPSNDNLWTLKSHLIEFNSTVGRHTGVMIGNDLIKTIRKFMFEKQACICCL
jgi:hypothetical protein